MRVSPTATTYAATHRNGASVALKILHRHLAADPEVAERFRREAYAANSVAHPGVVKIVDDDTTEDGCAVLVMDLVEGEPLEELRRAWGGRLPLDVAVDFVGQLLDIVAVAHDQGIVHRDLQPESVVIAPGGRVRLFDFGIAKLRAQAGAEDELTQNGVVLGAPPFMAPEQALGRRELVDAQTDIFSAGATLFLLLSGQGLHDVVSAPTPLAQIITASSQKARSLREVVAADLVPDGVVAVVDRALAFRKAERWLDARSFAEALRAAAQIVAAPHPADDAADDDDPTWTTAPELEPALVASLVAAQGIVPPPAVEPPPRPAKLFAPSVDAPLDDATIPVPESVIEAARRAGAPIPGTAPAARSETPASGIPKAPSSRRIVRKMTPSAPRVAVSGGGERRAEVEPALEREPAVARPAAITAPLPPPNAAPEPEATSPADDEPPTSVAKFPPRRTAEVALEADSVIVHATPVPPALAPAPVVLAEPPPAATSSGRLPAFVGPAPSSSRMAAGGPPSRRRNDDATVLLNPKKEPKRESRTLLVVLIVIVSIVGALLAANLVRMRH